MMHYRLGFAVLLMTAAAGFLGMRGNQEKDSPAGCVSYLNPEGLHSNPAFSQAVVVSGKTRTVYIGGQNAVDASGAIIGKGDIGKQAEQVFKNLEIALAAADAKLEHVVKWTVYVVQGSRPAPPSRSSRKTGAGGPIRR